MKKISILLILMMTLVLMGCGKTALDANDVKVMKELTISQKDCYASRKLDLTGVPDAAKGYAVISYQNTNLVLGILGKDPCRVTNAFDAQIAEVKAKNEVLKDLSGKALNASLGYIAGEVIKTGLTEAGDSFKSEGMGETYVTQEHDSRNVPTSIDDSYNTLHEDSYNTAKEGSENVTTIPTTNTYPTTVSNTYPTTSTTNNNYPVTSTDNSITDSNIEQ